MSRKAKAAGTAPETPFADMPTLAIERLSNALGKHGELMYQRRFGLHLSECRVLAIVLTREPTSLSEVWEQMELDKGHVSRLVTKLVAAGLVDRRLDAGDQRSSYLVLTPSGREMARKVQSAGGERNRAWMAGLPEDEFKVFIAAVVRMTQHARGMLVEEARRTSTAATLSPPGARVAGAQAETRRPRPLLVHRPVLEDIRRQLDRLLANDGEVASGPPWQGKD